MQVEDSRGKTCDQDVRWFVECSSGQVVKVPVFVEKVSEIETVGQMVTLIHQWENNHHTC